MSASPTADVPGVGAMPSPHEQAFLQAIIEDPDDDSLRLVYAD
jgi:hypothetical protein